MKNLSFITVLIFLTSFTVIGLPTIKGHEADKNNSQIVEKNLKFTIDKQFLVFPVRENNKKIRVNVRIEGKYYDDFDISLSYNAIAEFYVFIDLEKYQGQDLEVLIPEMNEEQLISLDKIKLMDKVPGFDSLYKESLRPKFHFTSKRGVIGDPNGLVYHDGIYHMYHQHNPYGRYFQNTGWGHATSKDLIHWKQHNEAIRPASYKDDAYSGSAVVDYHNTSGFKSGEMSPIVAAYTSTKRGECIVFSIDGGMTFTAYKDNPVLGGAPENRDPTIFWYEPKQHWVMARHYAFEKKGYIGFYSSPDLKKWTLESKEGFFHSCPGAYELPVIGMSGMKKWIIHDMFGLYKVGDFDGEKFTSDVKEKIQFNYGSAYVAGQAFSNHPENKVVLMAFSYNGACPDMPFNNCMLFPVELRLKKTLSGIRMCPKPIDAISKLHDQSITIKNKSVSKINDLLESKGDLGDALHLKLKLENVQDKFTLEFNGATIIIDRDSLFCKGNLKPPVEPIERTAIDRNGIVKGPLNTGGIVELELILDKTTLEIFGNDGELYMPIGLYFYPNFMAGIFGNPYGQTGITPFMDTSKRGVKMHSKNNSVKVEYLEVHTMKSIWE
ncbi:MAG: glycoside hydrolase family 32 protein [Bacteroidetes bacterium]|nr:glycoside hydrolase family 32 protein [Bacteroidota bacterium]MDA1120788.1 glycoside hydrolase family 32 protein [Bacteroidota bacterium]